MHTRCSQSNGLGLKYSIMYEQITMLRSEVLHLLKHVHDVKVAIDEAERAIYEDEIDEVKVQLITMKAELDTIISYFETQHRIGIKQTGR